MAHTVWQAPCLNWAHEAPLSDPRMTGPKPPVDPGIAWLGAQRVVAPLEDAQVLRQRAEAQLGQHPGKGLLLPIDFLPVVEDHALGIDIGEWVIETALSQIENWQAQGFHLPVSINAGARQLQQANFVLRLRALLARHPGVNPADLTLEILETSALNDITYASQVIEDCHQLSCPAHARARFARLGHPMAH